MANPLIDPDDLVVDAVLAIPLGFPLVPQMVKYTSVLTQWIVEGLVVRYPFLSAGVIGKSVMGKDIHSLWIGTGEKQVFYSASYHANESITTPVLLTFAEEYAAAYAAGGNIAFSSAAREENDGQTGMGPVSYTHLSGLDKLVAASYSLLGLISFLTAGEDECRAWTIKKGTKAPQAAGKIHTDFERGFIKAEVVNYQDLLDNGSLSAAREKGIVGMEGKDYVVKDGDVILFRFNV